MPQDRPPGSFAGVSVVPVQLDIYRTAIPMRRFEHAAAAREVAEAVLVRLEGSDGQTGWGETLPEWLKNTITLERLVENMRSQEGDGPTGTDAEACAYLYTAGLTAPMDSDWSQIYLYVATRTYEKWRTKDSGATMPEDIRVDDLSDYQISHLKRLRRWIYD